MTLENIIKESKELLTEQFEKGVGLRGTPLKRFSGPTLENWSENTIKSIIKERKNLSTDCNHSMTFREPFS